MKVVCGIVTYRPDPERLMETLRAVRGQTDAIIVADNGSPNREEWEKYLNEQEQRSLIRNRENRGIAAALNQIMALAETEGAEWCFTLDQDSSCSPGLVQALLSCADESTAVIGPEIIYRNNEQFVQQRNGTESVSWVITSGSLLSLAVWKRIGGFDESLFIDGVDKDYCIRAGQAGYRILKVHDAVLHHELGDLQCRSVFGKVIYVTHHSPWRLYYMTRNSFYLDAKLGTSEHRSRLLKNLFKTIFFERERIDRLRKIREGVHAGKEMAREVKKMRK